MLFNPSSDPFNIGNPTECTVLEFAKTVQQLFNPEVELVLKPLPVDDPKTRQPDIGRARSLLDWEPVIGLEEGLRKTYGYFVEVLENETGSTGAV